MKQGMGQIDDHPPWKRRPRRCEQGFRDHLLRTCAFFPRERRLEDLGLDLARSGGGEGDGVVLLVELDQPCVV